MDYIPDNLFQLCIELKQGCESVVHPKSVFLDPNMNLRAIDYKFDQISVVLEEATGIEPLEGIECAKRPREEEEEVISGVASGNSIGGEDTAAIEEGQRLR
ncbi:hypothetical protein Cni_G18119 [Canna indica]|uniref:Uncharacterized protein n=1 Tax=Canna indica TaxID=4628 RepID=A0AAQ3QE36_9LILI|nr:hypothetical protein Cni_G18119 [Canna indica]